MFISSDLYGYNLQDSRRRDKWLWLFKTYLHGVLVQYKWSVIMKSLHAYWILLSADTDISVAPWYVSWPASLGTASDMKGWCPSYNLCILVCVRGVSVKWRTITRRPLGKFLIIILAILPSTLIFTRDPCSFDGGRTGFVWVTRVWNSNVDPKSHQMRGVYHNTISQYKIWTSSWNSQTICCCL